MSSKLWAQMSIEEKLDALHDSIQRLIEIATAAATDVDSRLVPASKSAWEVRNRVGQKARKLHASAGDYRRNGTLFRPWTRAVAALQAAKVAAPMIGTAVNAAGSGVDRYRMRRRIGLLRRCTTYPHPNVQPDRPPRHLSKANSGNVCGPSC